MAEGEVEKVPPSGRVTSRRGAVLKRSDSGGTPKDWSRPGEPCPFTYAGSGGD